MKNINIGNVLYGLGIIIPFCYIALGFALLLTDIFPNLDEKKMNIFGIIIILYGIFRVYKLYLKFRTKDEE
jgi:cytochrome c biogenesis protein CcdA